MNFGGGQSHRAADVLNLQPGAAELFRPLRLRDHAQRATLHYLRDELVRVKEGALDRYKEAARSHTTRIMTDVSYDSVRVRAGKFPITGLSDLLKSCWLLIHGKGFYAAAD